MMMRWLCISSMENAKKVATARRKFWGKVAVFAIFSIVPLYVGMMRLVSCVFIHNEPGGLVWKAKSSREHSDILEFDFVQTMNATK